MMALSYQVQPKVYYDYDEDSDPADKTQEVINVRTYTDSDVKCRNSWK